MWLDLRPLRLELRRIPQRLPEHYLQPLWDLGAPAILRRALSRFASITVTQAATGLSLARAAAVLDVPPGWGYAARHAVRGWAERHDRRADLEAALSAVIDRLTADPPEADYRARRQALADWLIPPETWTSVTVPLQAKQLARNRLLTTDWGPDKHRATSLVLWAVMTRGDYLTAPLFRAATTPADRPFVRVVHRLMFYLDKPQRAGRGGHVFDLLDAFADLRTETEHAIDTGSAAPRDVTDARTRPRTGATAPGPGA
ncbi:hypothetical protein VA596_46980 [Amycolatopsis sp., V23-08]|uniref:Uncharacterized protein n=1 Tax=Amycolatopsis heterodermiae TaxID=3110235 RepID=A0ABU5RLS7_9PSEU|nr:hypothetical protein [Amycolatopsis sp., V23-08]MEA5367143.1 hypothetical protein [Amycolatopsis sp., V23-08]